MASHKKSVVLSAAKDLLPASAAIVACASLVVGCKSSSPVTTPSTKHDVAAVTYPPRPTTPPPPFKLFHAADGTFTLVTDPKATDAEIEAIIWQLRDAAHTSTFDKLHIPQKAVDARSPAVWFHVYRGAKCAAEKYAPGAPPCGASYHAAGEYTFGSYKPKDWDEGALVKDEDHQMLLWPSGSPYVTVMPAFQVH